MNLKGASLGWALVLLADIKTRVERFAWDKHSSLLQIFVNYSRKRVITLGPGSTVVENTTHNQNISGSNPAIGIRRE